MADLPRTVFEWMPDHRTWVEIPREQFTQEIFRLSNGHVYGRRMFGYHFVSGTAFRTRFLCAPPDAEEIAEAEQLARELAEWEAAQNPPAVSDYPLA